MSITTKLSTNTQPTVRIEYPLLMIGSVTGVLYMFTDAHKSVKLSGDNIGDVITHVEQKNCRVYHGSITMTQE